MVEAWAPGKLMLSGEWSVLEVGNPAIVLSVDRGVSALVEKSEEMVLRFPDIGVKEVGAEMGDDLILDSDEKALVVPSSAVETALRYISESGKEIGPFSLTTHSQISEVGGEKIGFGSSAASTVSTIAALLSFHGLDAERETVFKLSALAHYLGQGRIGSGFDIAASTYGDFTLYRRFDPDWLIQAQGERPLDELVEVEWPGLEVSPLSPPSGFTFSVGWTGKGASTRGMVKEMRKFKEREREEYERLISAISQVTERLAQSFGDPDAFSLLEENRRLLSELGEASGVPIETPKLAKLAEIAKGNGGHGKLSGAGGGDCGIAVTFNKGSEERLKREWEAEGILPVEVSLSQDGVKLK